MPRSRVTMRKVNEILRLAWAEKATLREIAASVKASPSSVFLCLQRAKDAGLSWPLPEGLDEEALEARLYPAAPESSGRPLPDWKQVHQELRRKGVTLALLWEEHQAVHPTGLQYSRFCDHYRAWAGRLNLSMRQEHRAGEKLFVDYAGQVIPVVRSTTHEIVPAQLFVAVLGASNYTYAEATWSQELPDWIGSHVRAFEYLCGVPEVVVPDNLKSGVTKACFYEPDLNPTYQKLAEHYGVVVLPARSGKPKDKAKVEVGVQIAERWILGRLRNREFFSLSGLNRAIRELLADLNGRPFRKLPGCRRSAFETIDKPALRPLPSAPYQYAEWSKVRVNIDYHAPVNRHYYSVPYTLRHKELDARATASTVEFFFNGQRVASHVRDDAPGRYTTQLDHMPRSHRAYAEWSPSRFIRWAQEIGPATAEVVTTILENRPHPEHGFRTCLGILHLAKRYPPERMEAACRRAIVLQACTYKSVASILKTGLDRRPLPIQETAPGVVHGNIRGPEYYDEDKGSLPC